MRAIMDWFRHTLETEYVRAILQGIGGFFLVSNTSLMLVYHVAFGTFSLISVVCGAILGLHAVCRLVLPICRRQPAQRVYDGASDDG